MEDETHNGGLGDPGPQNLNDLQSYLVNFNKEIGVHGEGSAFHHTVSQMINQSAQPVFVTVPVSSETTTPDEEQLPVISGMKDGKSPDMDEGIDGAMTTGEDTLSSTGATDDHMIYEITPKQSPLSQVVVDAQIEGLEAGRVQLQELNLEQLGLQQGIAVSDGMVMLPMGDACNLLGQTSDHKVAQVQIVNINGQPTLQLVGDSSILQQQFNHTVVASEPQVIPSIVPNSSIQSLIDTTNPIAVLASVDTTNPVAVLASVAANTNSVNQLQASQIQNIQIQPQEAQLVALRDDSDSTQPQVLALSYGDMEAGSTGMIVSQEQEQQGTSLLKKSTGYQSVAILPSGDTSQGEVNYVLIVNPAGDKDNNQGPTYDFGGNITGEVVEEVTDETGTTKRLVKINQLIARNNQLNIRDVPADQLACTHCDYTSPKKYLLSRHMKSHCDDRPHKCGICNRGFKTVSSLQNHINTHAGVRPHKCKMCESAFTTSGELIRHIRYKHTFEKPHKCTECEYASVELSKLKRHMRSHTGERPYACAYCNYASPDTYKLKRHMRIHTGEKPYECDICHAKFTQSNSLKAHRLIHSGNKPVFQCSLCPTTCGRKTDLKIHMQKLHSTDQPLLCKKCGSTFPDRYTFKVHFKSHEGEKCFRCTECDYSAISQRHVDTHMLVHSGLKPFECEDCDLAFRQKALLKRHRNLYHNPHYIHQDVKDREPECKACEKSFGNKSNVAGQIHNPSDALTERQVDSDETETDISNIHTCGGCPKSLVDSITPLTADQLIENSLLADMKEGKLGASPKVVVVHPDGRVEEVTAKLQSLSQSKPMDDFLVSLGVSGDSHFDQVSGLPADVIVSEVNTLVTSKDENSLESQPKYVQSNESSENIEVNEVNPTLDTSSFPVAAIVAGLDIDHTKEEGTQASFDSDDEDKKVKVLSQEEFLSLAQGSTATDLRDCFEENGYRIIQVDQPIVGNVPQIVVSMLSTEENSLGKRTSDEIGDDDEEQALKRLRTETLQTDE